ncbi:hypothetical protein [Aquiflexum gelatinilyticum]|uniref:glycosyl-4,4'-diaponeurosporenoate acyltransferase CrtO family protein n=1 Tax=Aquiflexum gelatinilyticum TaxID=2961943 RepID=UPI0021679C1F|nr:hypothetical protein [Aquiflexum gelatinilyticum]MCS4435889.1 hypothetical protein [Aquiflexum gelatinilyticum]
MAKKIFFPLMSIFLAYNTYKLFMVFSSVSQEEFSFLLSFILAILLNLFVTGIFAFTGFVYPSSRLMPDSYYVVKNPKAITKAYRYLGVKYFRSFLMMIHWGKEKNRKKYFDGTKSGIKDFDFQTRQSEFGHLAAFVVISFACAFLLQMGHFQIVLLTMALNIPFNLYPVILQRIHRVQIQRLKKYISS